MKRMRNKVKIQFALHALKMEFVEVMFLQIMKLVVKAVSVALLCTREKIAVIAHIQIHPNIVQFLTLIQLDTKEAMVNNLELKSRWGKNLLLIFRKKFLYVSRSVICLKF